MSLLDVADLTHAFKKNSPVLLEVNMRAEPGEIIGLVGVSGAGKSTLLRCMNGLITPSTGRVSVFGEEIAHVSEKRRRLVRRQIGMIFQEFNLIERLSVLANVLVGRLGYSATLPSCLRLFRRQDVVLARACLAEVGLAEYEARRARDLSGGQKQRVAIARAMAQGARIVLGDEATANLDMRTADGVMRLLLELAQNRKVLLVLSLHNLETAKKYCTRVVGLKAGRLIFDGLPEQLTETMVEEILG